MGISEIYSIYQKYPTISTDSRSIAPNSIFFALKGENFDANEFAKQALEQGAKFCIIDNPKYFIDHRTVLVENVLTTLQGLAQHHRKQLSIPFIGITGTNGKTTTKELISCVLSKKYNITFTKGNLNNHIGVPLTLLSIPTTTEIAIIEMGANHPKEIETLCGFAQPNFGLITNIGRAHLEGFGDFETVIKTKTELYNHIQTHHGTVFVNGDDPLLMELSASLHRTTYGSNSNCSFQGNLLEINPFVKVGFKTKDQYFTIQTKLIGKYNIDNILAAIAIGLYFNVEPQQIVTALEQYQPNNMRSQIQQTSRNQLIIDTYNANPSSMNAALDNFSYFTGNKALILGDMLELGKWSKEEHQKIIDKIENQKINNVFLVGKTFCELANNPPFQTFENVGLLVQYFQTHTISDTIILIKGSRGIQLEQVILLL